MKQNTNILQKIVTGAAITAAALMVDAKASAANGAAEVMAGNESAVLDVKVAGELAPRVGIFVRGRTTVGYDAEVSMMGLANLSYTLASGLDVVAGARFSPGAEVVPRAGLQYFQRAGDWSALLSSTVLVGENPDSESVVALQYRPVLGRGVGLYSSLENLTILGEHGHQFSAQRLRLGLDLGGYQFGAAGDLTEAGRDPQVSYNLGGFVRREF